MFKKFSLNFRCNSFTVEAFGLLNFLHLGILCVKFDGKRNSGSEKEDKREKLEVRKY